MQLDVLAALPDAAENLRICITDGVWREFGAASGRYAVTGLFPADTYEITADVLDEAGSVTGRVGPVILVGSYGTADLDACEACSPCESSGQAPAVDDDSSVLGLRFRADAAAKSE